MSIASFDALPWESICYAAVTLCCIAFVFKHCFETVEKILQLVVLFFAALGVYISWGFVKENGWQTVWQVLSGTFEHQRGKLPETHIAQGAFQFLNKLWA